MAKIKEKPSIYVASGIEHAKNLDWRNWLQQKLEHKYNVIIPDLEKNPYTKDQPAYGKWVFERFIAPDLENVVNCDHFFVLIDESFLSGAGAKAEVTLAVHLGTPIVYCLSGVSISDLNGWTIGCLFDAKRVNNLKEAVNYYKELNGTRSTN